VTGETKGKVPNIETVREIAGRVSNWGRWGDRDELGTLNLVGADDIVRAAGLVKSGQVFSLAIPFDSNGPQHAGSGRFNPIHYMSVDGRDFMSGGGTPEERDRRRGYLQNADSVVIMPLQSATQWDGLAHVFFEQQTYNGYSASYVNSSGAQRLSVGCAAHKIVGRGVLLDLPRTHGVPYLEPGHAISGDDLDRACSYGGVSVARGDFLLIRTGAMARAKKRGEWGDYAGGDAPGIGLESVDWLREHDVAGIATDTWDAEVRPVQTSDVAQPLHIILLVHMGLWLGEIFDLEALATACQRGGRYEFFFSAPPLPITGGIGSPVNPVAVL
jgi:kynurenine formamidase